MNPPTNSSARTRMLAFLMSLNLLCCPPAKNSTGLLKLNSDKDLDRDDRIDHPIGIDPELIGW